MRYCYISRDYKDVSSAGNKAKTDIESIMQAKGFVNLGLGQTVGSGVVSHFFRNLLGVIKAIFAIKKGDVLVLQYPMKKYYETVCKWAHLKGAIVITQIHDLNSFRSKRLTIPREIQRLSLSDGVIAHNDTMLHWLFDNGYKGKLHTLGIFDYLSTRQIPTEKNLGQLSPKTYSMYFLGNLNPNVNAFLYAMPQYMGEHRLHLYGFGYPKESTNDNLQFHGFADAEDLMAQHPGDFGLSWYGDSLEEGKGKIGEYMSYNNPHKVSLYIRCSMPVIIHSKAGLASFVRDNHIGVCVDSLKDIDTVLSSISQEEYMAMRENVKKVAARIAEGYYFSTAFDTICKELTQE